MPRSLDLRLTFDTFVVGPGNRLAAAAARRAAESPGSSYNPLVIQGTAGVGKTHLLNAIGQLALAIRPDMHLDYETAEGYIDRLAGEVASGTYHFREEHVGLGMLLLDGIEFLEGKGQTQAELLWIWEAMVAAGSQVILTSGRPLAEVDGLDQRLISRFSGGLMLDVAPPEVETRIGIVESMASQRGAELDRGVAEAIARLSPGGVRELRSRLDQLLMVQESEERRVPAAEVFRLFGAAPPPSNLPAPSAENAAPAGGDEFTAFLSDISSTVGEVVEATPWRQTLAGAILRWEGEGIRTLRLEQTLEGEEPADVGALIDAFAADVARLREVERELREIDPRTADSSLLRDPDRLPDVERLLATVRSRPRAISNGRVAGAGSNGASASHSSAPGADTGGGVDPWFLDREKLAWSWVSLDDRLIEELN